MGKLISGLLVGLVLGVLVGYWLPDMNKPDPWLPAGLTWQRLPGHAPAGPLPQTFSIPPTAYDYGASTLPIGPMLKAEPSLLRIEVETTSGNAGLLLTSPDGSQQLSNEKPLTAKDGRTTAYFRIGPTTPQAVVILRNYNNPGAAGSATIHAASYAPISALDRDALAAINAAGVN
jgi:hypothetical protein